MLLLVIIIALFVVFLVYNLVERDVTTKQDKPRKAGFSISDDGDLHVCQCDVSAYSLTTLLGTLEVDLSVLEDFNVCEVSSVDCVSAALDCLLGITPGGCDIPPGASCDDYGVCTEEMRGKADVNCLWPWVGLLTAPVECEDRCVMGLQECITATMAYVLIDDYGSESYFAEILSNDLELDPSLFDKAPSCELECVTELVFGFNFCLEYLEPVEDACVERYLALLESVEFFQAILSVADGPPIQDIAAAFCNNTGTFEQCLYGTAYPAFGQCTRHACNSTRYCTALERAALLGELITKMNTFLGSALVNVPQYYGSEKETIKSIERFFDQTLDFWAEFVLQQGQEFLDATVTLCVDGRGLCGALQEIYSPLHSVRKEDLKTVLREILLSEVERNKEEIYERYLDLCGDVTCVVFQEKSAFSVFVSSLGAAGGNMGTVFLVLALLYAPIYSLSSNRSKSSDDSTSVSNAIDQETTEE